MSYNTLKVNSKKPAQNGEILLELDNIEATNPTDGQVLKTDSLGDWVSGSLPSVNVDNVLNIDTSPNYAVSIYPYGAGDNLIIYKPILDLGSGVSFVNASGAYVPIANSSWTMGYSFAGSTFANKTVILRATPSPFCTASFVAQWGFGTGSLASFTPIGPRARIDNRHADIAWGRFVGSGSNQVVALKIISRTGSSSAVRLCTGVQSWTYSIDVKVF
jgi:hypothetical protein